MRLRDSRSRRSLRTSIGSYRSASGRSIARMRSCWYRVAEIPNSLRGTIRFSNRASRRDSGEPLTDPALLGAPLGPPRPLEVQDRPGALVELRLEVLRVRAHGSRVAAVADAASTGRGFTPTARGPAEQRR